MIRGGRQRDDVTRLTRRTRSWEVTASELDHVARLTGPAAHDARIVHARSRAIADLQRSVAQPPPVAATAERTHASPRHRSRTNWTLWIVVAVGSAALVAAGYLGALVQLSAPPPQGNPMIPQTAASVSPLKSDSSATPS